MYYFFEAKSVDWHDTLLDAEVFEQPELEDRKIWDIGKPLTGQDIRFGFSIPEGAPLFDNHQTWDHYALYSPKLMAILRSTGIKFEAFPARVLAGEQEIDIKYEVFRLLEINDCINQEKTQFEVLQTKTRTIKIIDLPVYTPAFLKSGILLTRIAGFEKDVVIHEDLKKILESAGITGCDFKLRQLDKSILGSA